MSPIFPGHFDIWGNNHIFRVYSEQLYSVLYKLKGCEKMGHGAMGNSGRFRSMQHGLVSLVDLTPTATVSDVVARSARGS
jgi:hypothetical protein